MSDTETRDARRPVRLVQVDAETLRQLRSDRDRYKSDRDDAWAKCAAGECDSAQLERERADRLTREAVTAAVLGARDPGGNLIEYVNSSTAAVLADAVLAILNGEKAPQ